MSKQIYRNALIIWSFIAGVAVAVATLWLLNTSPNQVVDRITGEPSQVDRAMWHEYQKDDVSIEPATSLVQERSNAIINAVEEVSPAVVGISIIVESRYLRSGYRDYWGHFDDRLNIPTRTVRRLYPKVGTGFIINAEGVIVTNHHVIEQGSDIVVTLQDGREYEGTLLGKDEALDLAVLKIEGRNFPYARLGNSDALVAGEWAIAIGNPFGSLLQDNQPTVTVGVISAINRQFVGSNEEGRYYQNMLQTDAAINPGNSGGPLVNAYGEVIGVNTFIFTKSGGNIGLGFARPINEVKRLVEEILTYGKVRKITLGLGGQGIGSRMASMLNLPDDVAGGIMITYVAPDSPASTAGLERGDVFYKMDGIPVTSVNDAQAKINSLKVGDRLELNVYRDGKRFETIVVAQEKR